MLCLIKTFNLQVLNFPLTNQMILRYQPALHCSSISTHCTDAQTFGEKMQKNSIQITFCPSSLRKDIRTVAFHSRVVNEIASVSSSFQFLIKISIHFDNLHRISLCNDRIESSACTLATKIQIHNDNDIQRSTIPHRHQLKAVHRTFGWH